MRSASILILVLCFTINTNLIGQDSLISVNKQDLWFNGGNVAWVNFARDVGPTTLPEADFQAMFDQVRENGGNAMRLWVHITGGTTPEWSGNEVIGPGAGTIDDLEILLEMAEESGVGLILCLWSFDMLRTSNGSTIVNRSKALLESASLTQSYIDNALIPMVEALGDHPALLAWEIFNEPEGMSNEFGWDFTRHTAMSNIQRFVNQTAGAIHRANPNALVSNGSWSFHSLAKTSNGNSKNYYSDEELIAAGGDSLGVLDFYMVHYYDWGGTELSPFHNQKDSWGLNKPVVVGEFGIPENELFGIPSDSLYKRLYDNGYAGALVWQWVDWYQDRGNYGPSWLRGLGQMKFMQENYPSSINLKFDKPGIRSFKASLNEIESGGQSELTWDVRNASLITLDGVEVDSVGSKQVSPGETTTYELIAHGDTIANDTAYVEIAVLPAGAINRALSKPARASTFETCCGEHKVADFAFDGDNDTRWSSAWSDGTGNTDTDPNTDSNPDEEWIDVDLQKGIEVGSVLLDWETAYSSSYEIQTSLDGINWSTVYNEDNGDGGRDSIVFNNPEFARFVRMQAFDRATEFGHSIWEFEVRGSVSIEQPPEVVVISPADGKKVEAGKGINIEAEASDPDGEIQYVTFFVNGDSVGIDDTSPYQFMINNVPEGNHELYVKTVDEDGLVVQSSSVFIEGRTDIQTFLFEAEDAVLSGETSVQPGTSGASKGAAVYMEGGGAITWEDLNIPAGDAATIRIRYNLPFDYKENILVVNGVPIDTIVFEPPIETWQNVTVPVDLSEVINSISIQHSWGYMMFDYIELTVTGITTSNETDESLPSEISLDQNYPNPFNPTTSISFSIPQRGRVLLEVYNLLGQKVETLVQERVSAGTHQISFDASALSSGIYLLRLQTDAGIKSRKMMLIK